MRSRPPSRSLRPSGRTALEAVLLTALAGCCVLAGLHWLTLPAWTAAPGSKPAGAGPPGRLWLRPLLLPRREEPVALAFPIWWHAPFASESGLGTEALSILAALVDGRHVRPQDLYLSHSGDVVSPEALQAMDPTVRGLFEARRHRQLFPDEQLSAATLADLEAEHVADLEAEHVAADLEAAHVAAARRSRGDDNASWQLPAPPADSPEQQQQQQQQQQQLVQARVEVLRDRPVEPRPAVAVCHNWFECWRVPDQPTASIVGCPCPFSRSQVAYTVARTMFETAGLPDSFVKRCNAMDEVWVPTAFNVESFAAAGVRRSKLFVVPEALDTRAWDPARYSRLETFADLGLTPVFGSNHNATIPRQHYVFLSVFKWEARKGWKELLLAYFRAFPKDSSLFASVELVIVTKPFYGSGVDFAGKMQAWAARRVGLTADEMRDNLPRVWVTHRQLTKEVFRRLYRSVDCLALPTHGEGWGRPQMEAMAMEVPVISTNWSGPLAFMDDRTAYMVRVDRLVTVEADEPGFFPVFVGQKWAQPSVVHLAALMRRAAHHRGEAKAKGRAARRHIVAHFSDGAVAAAVTGHLRRIEALLVSRAAQEQRRRAGVV